MGKRSQKEEQLACRVLELEQELRVMRNSRDQWRTTAMERAKSHDPSWWYVKTQSKEKVRWVADNESTLTITIPATVEKIVIKRGG